MPHLVWVRGTRGPSPQVWMEFRTGKDSGQERLVLAHHEMKVGEAGLPLDALAKRYPPPAILEQ